MARLFLLAVLLFAPAALASNFVAAPPAPQYTDCSATATMTTASPGGVGDLTVSYTTQQCKVITWTDTGGHFAYIYETLTFAPTYDGNVTGNIRLNLPFTTFGPGYQNLTIGSPMTAFTWTGTPNQLGISVPSVQNYAIITIYKSATANSALNITALTSGSSYTINFSGTVQIQ